MCSPGLTLEAYFATAAPWEQPIFERIHPVLRNEGPLIVDPLRMGIMFKNGPMFAQLRAMKKWVAVGFSLGEQLRSARLSRKVVAYNNKFFHVINLTDPELVDDELLDWLCRSYHFAGGTDPAGQHPDPMVPSDVDEEL